MSKPEEGFVLSSERARLWITFDQGRTSHKVTSISPVHLIFEAVDSDEFKVGSECRFSLRIRDEDPRLSDVEARVVSSVRRRGVNAIELSFGGAAVENRRRICEVVKELLWTGELGSGATAEEAAEIISDPDEIMEICRALMANHAEGYASCRGSAGPPHLVNAGRLDKKSDYPLHWWMERPWPQVPFRVRVHSYNSIYSFDVDEYLVVDGLVAFRLPKRLVRSRVRSNRRISISDMTVTFRHPDNSEMRITRKVVNVSHYGLAFQTNLGEDQVYPGLEIPALVVSTGDNATLLQGKVRHVSLEGRSHSLICGIEVFPKSPFHPRIGWAHILEPHLHPSSGKGSGEDVGALWDLLHTSGYFALSGKSVEDFNPMLPEFTDVSERYAQHPAMGCQVLWRSEWGTDATISISLMYSGTWILYQLARRRGREPVGIRGRQIVRDVYVHAFEHAAWYPTLQWVIAYNEANVGWHKATHQAFADRYGHTGKVMNLPFHLMEGDARRVPSPENDLYEIDDATTEELELFISKVREIYPQGFADAIDLVPSRFYLEEVNRTLARANLYRDRRLFVARVDGRPVAAAVCETGTPGMHLFRLFEGVRLVALDDSEDQEPALLRLIDHARNWYAEQGRDAFTFFMQRDQFELGMKAGLKDLNEGYAWLIHTSLIDDFLEHINRLSAPRDVPTIYEQIPGRGRY